MLVVADAAAPAMRALAEAAGARVIGTVAVADGAADVTAWRCELVLADLRRGAVPPALIDALAHAPAGVVLADLHQLDDAAGTLAFAPGMALVSEADAFTCSAELSLALARRRPEGVREEHEEERAAQLRRIAVEMERLARALTDVADAAPARASYLAAPGQSFRGPAAEPAVDAAAIRALIRARRLRDQYFAAALFADPAWDMLLDLMAARLEGGQVSVSSLCIAAAVPPTTALRWIGVLADAGQIVRVADPHDRRRIFIALSDAGAEAMAACLAAALRGGALPM